MQRESEILGNTSPVECRSTSTSPMTLQGYAIVWESRSQPLGPQGVIERVASTFVNKQRADTQFRDIVVSYDHRNDFLLGAVGANAVLDIDKTGARYTVDILPESRSGGDVYAWVRAGVVRGSSFQFITYQDDWDWVNGVTQRTLISGKIQNLGPTPNPAYLGSTAVALRSLATHVGESFDDVKALWDQGETRKLFTRTDIAPPVPTPLEVAQRNHVEPQGDSRELELRLALLAERGHRYGYDNSDPGALLLKLRRRKLEWTKPAEVNQ
jgi:HK97 family phage prohead protease